MKATSAQSARLRHLQGVWEAHAQEDPLWAIISIPEKKGGKWSLEEFMRTGTLEIDRLMKTLIFHEIGVSQACALDFGCGVGRLSQALCQHFNDVVGVDISPTMIRTAQELNVYPTKCQYLLNVEENLSLFEDQTFTFIYSNVVLQHMDPEIARTYLREFARILRPGGLLIFQLPSSYHEEEGLPANAWRASLKCEADTLSWISASRQTLAVRVTNISNAIWRSTGQRLLMLGNHWLDRNGAMLRLDDGRVLVPESLAPDQTAQLELELETPPQAGDYLLELDLVQEGVAWFKDKGSASLLVPVQILPARETPKTNTHNIATVNEHFVSPEELTPIPSVFEGFSMHFVPRCEVIQLLYDQDCSLEFIESSDSGGPGFRSYLYFARKSAGRG